MHRAVHVLRPVWNRKPGGHEPLFGVPGPVVSGGLCHARPACGACGALARASCRARCCAPRHRRKHRRGLPGPPKRPPSRTIRAGAPRGTVGVAHGDPAGNPARAASAPARTAAPRARRPHHPHDARGHGSTTSTTGTATRRTGPHAAPQHLGAPSHARGDDRWHPAGPSRPPASCGHSACRPGGPGGGRATQSCRPCAFRRRGHSWRVRCCRVHSHRGAAGRATRHHAAKHTFRTALYAGDARHAAAAGAARHAPNTPVGAAGGNPRRGRRHHSGVPRGPSIRAAPRHGRSAAPAHRGAPATAGGR